MKKLIVDLYAMKKSVADLLRKIAEKLDPSTGPGQSSVDALVSAGLCKYEGPAVSGSHSTFTQSFNIEGCATAEEVRRTLLVSHPPGWSSGSVGGDLVSGSTGPGQTETPMDGPGPFRPK